ncbi:MAG: hypothetical protein EVA26_04660 [Burkholderiaceae bacterium]|nr:MAG: hypothetical protein EVA26_04660 [Burkholderiaceae bacterium]
MQPSYLNSVNHYENFPVASILMPKKIRNAVKPFYAFARTADDIADCSDLNTETKIRLLNMFRNEITMSKNCGEARNSVETHIKEISKKLVAVLEEYDIDPYSVCDLLKAFEIDSTFSSFSTWSELINYCSYSANPVGRFLLATVGLNTKIHDKDKAEFTELSDKICTGLQLINFAQDIKEDAENNRCYVPKSEWPKSLEENNLISVSRLTGENKNKLVMKLVVKGEQNLLTGSLLPRKIRKSKVRYATRFSMEIALIIECGKNIVQQIKKDPSIVWTQPPKLETKKIPIFLYNSILNI